MADSRQQLLPDFASMFCQLIFSIWEILLPDMPSDPSLLAGMQNLTICWWTLWFLTNLLVDTGPNKIFISGLSRREKHGKCPFCPWLFLLPWSPSSGHGGAGPTHGKTVITGLDFS